MDTVITNARLRGAEGSWHVGIEAGRIRAMSRGPIVAQETVAAEGRLLTGGLVEAHLHLDKALTADRISWDRPRPTGNDYRRFQQELMVGLKRTFTHEDVMTRATRLLGMASASGTTTMRAQCEVDEYVELRAVEALLAVRDRMRGVIDLQIVVFPIGDILDRPDLVALVGQALALGADGVGGIPETDPERVDAYIDLLFRMAAESGTAVDFHVDQHKDVRTFSLPVMVEKLEKYGLQGRVTATHAECLAHQPRERVLDVLSHMQEKGIHLACLPYRYVDERIKIPKAKGINVSLINDNVRDPWQRGGSADLIQMAGIFARAEVNQHDAALEDAFDMISLDGARALGLPMPHGVTEGATADLLLFDADSVQHAICHHIRPTMVMKAGRVVSLSDRGRDDRLGKDAS